MKKFIITIVASLFACMSINAEEVMNDNQAMPEAPFTEITTQQADNGLMLVYPNLYEQTSPVTYTTSKAASYDDQGYRNLKKWKTGRTVRTVGMVMTGLGAVGILAGVSSLSGKKDTAGEAVASFFMSHVAVGAGVVGIAAGGIMWAVGNHNMRKARLSYTGNGIAYNF